VIALAENTYGKSSVRVMKVQRDGPLHTVKEWKVEVLLSGDFESCFTVGDNSEILPTDTMKNTVYSRARESTAECIEDFARELAEFFLAAIRRSSASPSTLPALVGACVVQGKPHPSTFVRGSRRDTNHGGYVCAGWSVSVTSGLDGLVLLKTANSGFEGYLKDSLTTCRRRQTGSSAPRCVRNGNISPRRLPFDQLRSKLRETLIDAFAEHDSKSVQHTLYAMAQAALEAAPEIMDVELAMPNKHCLLVDLSRFGQTNPNQIFVPTDEPYGNIVARICRETKGS
jgi:urate oxidase